MLLNGHDITFVIFSYLIYVDGSRCEPIREDKNIKLKISEVYSNFKRVKEARRGQAIKIK
jgi:hypothetical protein